MFTTSETTLTSHFEERPHCASSNLGDKRGNMQPPAKYEYGDQNYLKVLICEPADLNFTHVFMHPKLRHLIFTDVSHF